MYTCVCICTLACVYMHLDLACVFASSLPFFWSPLTPNDIVTINLDLASMEKCEPLITVVTFRGCFYPNV